MTDDRQTDHATEKCVGIGGTACAAQTKAPRSVDAKSFPSHKAHRAALISVSSARQQLTLRERGYEAGASRGDTHRTCPPRDGQAELTRVFGYELRWLATRMRPVTHPSSNRAGRRTTSLILGQS